MRACTDVSVCECGRACPRVYTQLACLAQTCGSLCPALPLPRAGRSQASRGGRPASSRVFGDCSGGWVPSPQVGLPGGLALSPLRERVWGGPGAPAPALGRPPWEEISTGRGGPDGEREGPRLGTRFGPLRPQPAGSRLRPSVSLQRLWRALWGLRKAHAPGHPRVQRGCLSREQARDPLLGEATCCPAPCSPLTGAADRPASSEHPSEGGVLGWTLCFSPQLGSQSESPRA